MPRYVADALRCGPFTLTRRLATHGRFELFRAKAEGELGPGCYLIRRLKNSADLIGQQMLARERLIAQQAVCPHLGCVLAAGGRDARPYNVLPYLDGVALDRVLAAAKPINLPMALFICRQVAEALAALHTAGWLHGRVEPAHIVLSPQRQATLIDLTAGRRLDSAECDVHDLPRGALRYDAPETQSRNRRLTAAADVYALGIVLDELLACGRPNVEPDISHLISRMTAREPLRRPSGEQAVRWLAELEIEALL